MACELRQHKDALACSLTLEFSKNQTVAYFPWRWLTFKLFELDAQKLPALCLMNDDSGKTETDKGQEKRWVECSLAQRQSVFYFRIVAMIDILTQAVVAVYMCMHVHLAELRLQVLTWGIISLVV